MDECGQTFDGLNRSTETITTGQPVTINPILARGGGWMQLILAAKRAVCRPGVFQMQVSTLSH